MIRSEEEMIQINPKFQKLLRPLTSDEYENLETDILQVGCGSPIELWNNFIVDGHHRFEICTKHRQSYKTIDRTLDFESEADVMEHIFGIQIGRRNLDFSDLKNYI